MSITDELRKWLKSLYTPNSATVKDEGERIADRIDAEHEAMLVDARKTVYQGYIELPKDADGEYIHFGDVLDQFGTPMTVLAMSDPDPDQGDCMLKLTTDGISDVTWVRARKMRHYHAPTVEDVLTEFGIDWEHESDCEDRAALLKEYASKLRLAEVEDA